ncbi:MAG: hypothetical protein ACI4YB_00805 [Oscillospiraceae bacterium]
MSAKQVTPYKKKRVLLDKKFSMVIYAVTLVLAVVCRTFQLKDNMNFAKGTYIDPGINWTMVVILVGFALLLAVMIFGESRDKVIRSCILINPMRLKAERLNKKVSPKAAASMFVMAGLLIYETIAPIVSQISLNKSMSTEDEPIGAFAGITAMQWINYAFMIVLCFTFISTGMSIFKGEGITKGQCVFITLYPIWKLVRTFELITTYQVIGPYSEKCYILMTNVFAALFFLNVVRFFCGYEKKRTRYYMILFGYAASITAAVSTLPRYAMFFLIDYTVREGMLSPDSTDVGLIFVTATIVAVFWSTYVYRVMPKLNLTGKRRWTGLQTDGNSKMESIDD